MTDPGEWWLTLAATAALAAYAFFGTFRALRRARLVEDVPTSRLRSAAQGYVELVGHAELLPGEPIVAPLSGRTCVWYRYRLEERERLSPRGGRDWRTVDQGVSDGLFRLVDESGDCVVDPDGAEVTPAVRDLWHGAGTRPAPPPPASGWRWTFGGRYRYHEELIRPGDPLHAVGFLRTVGSATGGPSAAEEARAVLAAWKRDRERMRAFDANRDGQVDLQEWEAARRTAEAQVLRERAQRASEPGIPVLSRPEQGGHPYLLSGLPEPDLAWRYRWGAAARLALLVMAGAALWLLLTHGPGP